MRLSELLSILENHISKSNLQPSPRNHRVLIRLSRCLHTEPPDYIYISRTLRDIIHDPVLHYIHSDAENVLSNLQGNSLSRRNFQIGPPSSRNDKSNNKSNNNKLDDMDYEQLNELKQDLNLFETLSEQVQLLYMIANDQLPSTMSLGPLVLGTTTSSTNHDQLANGLSFERSALVSALSSPSEAAEYWKSVLEQLQAFSTPSVPISLPKNLATLLPTGETNASFEGLKKIITPSFVYPLPSFTVKQAKSQLLAILDYLSSIARPQRQDAITAVRNSLSKPSTDSISVSEVVSILYDIVTLCQQVRQDNLPIERKKLLDKFSSMGIDSLDSSESEEPLRLFFRMHGYRKEREMVILGWHGKEDVSRLTCDWINSCSLPSDQTLSPRLKFQYALIQKLFRPIPISMPSIIPILGKNSVTPTSDYNNINTNEIPPTLIVQGSDLFRLQNAIQEACVLSCLQSLFPRMSTLTINRLADLLESENNMDEDESKKDGIRMDNLADEILYPVNENGKRLSDVTISKEQRDKTLDTIKRVIRADDPVFKLTSKRLKDGITEFLGESLLENGAASDRSSCRRKLSNMNQTQQQSWLDKCIEKARTMKGFDRSEVIIRNVAKILADFSKRELWFVETWWHFLDLASNLEPSSSPSSIDSHIRTGDKRRNPH